MNLFLRRDYSGEDCTLGILTVGSLALDTLELPWIADPSCKGGHPEKSCVPAGTYLLALHDTPDHPRTFALVCYGKVPLAEAQKAIRTDWIAAYKKYVGANP